MEATFYGVSNEVFIIVICMYFECCQVVFHWLVLKYINWQMTMNYMELWFHLGLLVPTWITWEWIIRSLIWNFDRTTSFVVWVCFCLGFVVFFFFFNFTGNYSQGKQIKQRLLHRVYWPPVNDFQRSVSHREPLQHLCAVACETGIFLSYKWKVRRMGGGVCVLVTISMCHHGVLCCSLGWAGRSPLFY